MRSLMSNDLIVVTVLVFVSVLLMLEGFYLLWRGRSGPEARKVQGRLQKLAATMDGSPQAQLLRQRLQSELPPVERYLQSLPRVQALDRFVAQAGLVWPVTRLIGLVILAGLATWVFTFSFMHLTMLTALVFTAAAATLPVLYVQFRRERRFRKIEAQLPDALDLITRALKAGHAFSSSLKMAGEEMPDPLAGELRAVHDEVNFGISLEQALTHLAERVPITDLRYFVVAVLIQRESGGNLTEILTNLSMLIRDRAKLMAKVRVLSSEGRMSAWVLGLMPFVLGGVLYLMNPGFMSLLWTDSIGITIVQYLAVMMVIGLVVLRKIVRIRV